MPGPKRQPRHLRLLKGTFQPARAEPDVGLPPAETVLAAPEWLPAGRARSQFARLAAVMSANRLLNEANVEQLAQYCALGASLAGSWAAGRTPSAALLNAHRTLATTLQLTSMRLPVVAPTKTSNRFSNNLQRKRGDR